MAQHWLQKFRTRTDRTVRITLSWMVVGAIGALFERAVLMDEGVKVSIQVLAMERVLSALVMGVVLGGIYSFLLRDRLRWLPFLPAFGIMASGIVLLFFGLKAAMTASGPGSKELIDGLWWGDNGPAWPADHVYWVLLMGATMLAVRLVDQYGSGALTYLSGRYFKPKQELRIFMFLDMRASMGVAERIGHLRYFSMLNDVYADITDPVLYSNGEIYQYVGDEVSVSWKLRKGLRDQRCLQCFFDIRDRLAEHADRYQQRYGHVPQFKAGFHYGTVTTGEVGLLKKDVIFSGDVVNTAARIQNMCNEHGVDLLISKDLLDILRPSDRRYTVRHIGEIALKGRSAAISLYSLDRASRAEGQ
ncbi:MAG: adenylate/guanylate cyclase domain-containing protein [Flavobacteriales bacterium]|nr:adenylate/guanylate cyclase domain-containing protein [Flavobacteriales bacterium]